MKIRPHAASYERGRRLVAAGCPLDYLESLPHKSGVFRKTLYIRELGGYTENRVIDFGAGTIGYVIGVAVGTDLPGGIVISDWSFVAPWDHYISWDYEPRDVVPKRDHCIYNGLFNSRLSGVMNDRRLLARGRPVEGLVCGRAFEPIPESVASGETVHGKLSLTSDTGYTVALRITLRVDRSIARAPNALTERRKGRLFDKPDVASPDPLLIYK
jgi:hypothetical protein